VTLFFPNEEEQIKHAFEGDNYPSLNKKINFFFEQMFTFLTAIQ